MWLVGGNMIIHIDNRPKKWVRSNEGWVAGVFEGLGRNFGINPNILRAIWLISFFFYGSGLLLYALLALVLPRYGQDREYQRPKILGVCHDLSLHFNMELGLIRLLAVASIFFSIGFTILVYLFLWYFRPYNKDQIYYN
jgi:phage shock protein PspC (stress-responsive transcriptional regulator)